VTWTPLEFVEDAISLSGLTGTKLKCDVIGVYYPFWWKITSGGKREEYQKTTSIIELNAATGEVYIKDIDEVVLGSAGHALSLKVDHLGDEGVKTNQLKVILVEDNPECYEHLKSVMRRRWPQISIDETEDLSGPNSSNIYLLNNNLDEALEKIENLQLGNALFYFDPLRSVEWDAIERVASKRMRSPFQTGTEFIVFLFTSDWFLGRENFAPLPLHTDEDSWEEEEKASVLEGDRLFGNQEWRRFVLNDRSFDVREHSLLDLYRNRLYRWFRYVLPMPFNPKENQLFHLILCSNYEAGVVATKSAYASRTLNPSYKPDNREAFKKFVNLHPETLSRLDKRRRPLEWLLLWKIIKYHEDGICDAQCRDFQENEQDINRVQRTLEWLADRKYLSLLTIESPWQIQLKRYRLNRTVVKDLLGVEAPAELKPLSPEEFAEVEMHRFEELLEKWRQAVSRQ
jgi:three-Cys-motif partner protein